MLATAVCTAASMQALQVNRKRCAGLPVPHSNTLDAFVAADDLCQLRLVGWLS